jgi:hypothetical protein
MNQMANFCGACGSQLTGVEGFCWKCGSPVQPGTQPPTVTPPPAAAGYQQVSAPANPAYAQVPAAVPPSPPAKSNTWITVLVVILAVFLMGGLLVVGGVLYVGHRVAQKMHQLSGAAGIGDPSPVAGLGSLTGLDTCRLLSKEDVSRALGVEIVATKAIADGCEYLAHGTAADMTARHMAALQGARGADSQQQVMIHKFAGGIFAEQESKMHEAGQDSDGNTPVLVIFVDESGAAAQMKVAASVMGTLGPGQTRLDGIGDEALDESGAMMLVRKGDKLIRITYTSCPCGTEAIKPLARKLADAV